MLLFPFSVAFDLCPLVAHYVLVTCLIQDAWTVPGLSSWCLKIATTKNKACWEGEREKMKKKEMKILKSDGFSAGT